MSLLYQRSSRNFCGSVVQVVFARNLPRSLPTKIVLFPTCLLSDRRFWLMARRKWFSSNLEHRYQTWQPDEHHISAFRISIAYQHSILASSRSISCRCLDVYGIKATGRLSYRSRQPPEFEEATNNSFLQKKNENSQCNFPFAFPTLH